MLLWALLLCCSAVKSDDTATKPAPVKTLEHLFLMGDSMETGGWASSTDNLVAKTHPPTRTGIMVVTPDRPWEYVIAGYNSVTKVNESDYRIYYDVIGPKGRFLCVALSTDGTTYTKPSLGLYKFEGSAQNNIVAVIEVPNMPAHIPPGACSGPYPRPLFCVFPKMIGTVYVDATAPPTSRFRFIGHYPLVSADGFEWSFLPGASRGQHVPFSDTQIAAYFDPHAGLYVSWPTAFSSSKRACRYCS